MSDSPQSRYDEFAADADAAPPPLGDERDLTTLERLVARFGATVLSSSTRLNEAAAIVEAKGLTEVMTWLRDEAGFVLLSALTAHDCHGKEPRFFVVYQLTNLEAPERLRVKVGVPEKKPVVDSVVALWPGANFLEREVYDLFGIEFKGHPNLTRIMMPEEWEGHPLRKDYPDVYEPVQFTHNTAAVSATKPFARR